MAFLFGFVEHQAVALQAARQIGYEPSDYGPGWINLAKRKTDGSKGYSARPVLSEVVRTPV